MTHKLCTQLILASSSPRRKELLHKITDNFIIREPLCDEINNGAPQHVAESNALLKGRAVCGDFVLACDTVVCMDNIIYGKPNNEKCAFSMLSVLNGKTHSVITGVYVRYFDTEIVFSDKSDVNVKRLTENEIYDYIKKYNPLDKAGSYGIQDGIVVQNFTGSLDNIIGLPTEKLREILRKFTDVKEENNY